MRKSRIDTSSHYARWDVTQLLENSEPYGPFVTPSTNEVAAQWRVPEETHDDGSVESEEETA